MKQALLSQPLFFQYIDTFISNIPHVNQLSDRVAYTTIPNDYLMSYIRHYHIDFINEGLASKYELWQSVIYHYRIVEQFWQANDTISHGKTLVIVHGYLDHTALFAPLIRWALQQGFNVHAFDLPGHGLSSGPIAAIESFDDYSGVLATILQREHYPEYHLIGLSTGGATVVNMLLNKRFSLFEPSKTSRLTIPVQVVLLSPLVRSHAWGFLRWLHFALRPIISHVPRKRNASSHNKAFIEFLATNDPLQVKKIPLVWLDSMEHWSQNVKKLSAYTKGESLIIQGTHDETIDWRYSMPIYRTLFPQAAYHYVEGARHHLVTETFPYWDQVTDLLERYLL